MVMMIIRKQKGQWGLRLTRDNSLLEKRHWGILKGEGYQLTNDTLEYLTIYFGDFWQENNPIKDLGDP